MDLVFNYLTPKIKHEDMQGLDFAIRMAETRLPDSKIPVQYALTRFELNALFEFSSKPLLQEKRRHYYFKGCSKKQI